MTWPFGVSVGISSGVIAATLHVPVAARLVGGARLFIRHLQGINEPAIKERAATADDSPLLQEFFQWMRAQRGTNDLTLYNYGIPIRALLQDCGEEPRRLRCSTPAKVRIEAKPQHKPLGDSAVHHGTSDVSTISHRQRSLPRRAPRRHTYNSALAPRNSAEISAARGYRAHH